MCIYIYVYIYIHILMDMCVYTEKEGEDMAATIGTSEQCSDNAQSEGSIDP